MSLTPELNQLVYSIIAFVILLFLLSKFAFPPLLKVIDERQAKIKESLDQAELTREEAVKLMDEYKLQLDQAKAEAQKLLEQSKASSEEIKQDILKKAKEQSQYLLAKAESDIENKKNEAVAGLNKQIAELSVLISSKVLSRSIEDKERSSLLAESLSELEKMTPSGDTTISLVGEPVLVEVFSAEPLNDDEANEVDSKIRKVFGKNHTIKFLVDTEIVGGLRIKVDHKIYDISVAGKLDQALEKMVSRLK